MKRRNIFPLVFPKVTTIKFPVIPSGNFCIPIAVYMCTWTNGLFKKCTQGTTSFMFFHHSAFSLIKHMLASFLFLLCLHKPSMHPALRPALSSSLLLCMGGKGNSYPPGTSPWCPPRARCRGPCGPPHRGPFAAAATRTARPVLLGWLGHWHSRSGHGTPGPTSWAEPLPLALLGVGERRCQATLNTSCLQASVWALCPTGMVSLGTSLLPHHPLGDPRTLACAKVRVKAWVLPLHKCFLSTYYPVLSTRSRDWEGLAALEELPSWVL